MIKLIKLSWRSDVFVSEIFSFPCKDPGEVAKVADETESSLSRAIGMGFRQTRVVSYSPQVTASV